MFLLTHRQIIPGNLVWTIGCEDEVVSRAINVPFISGLYEWVRRNLGNLVYFKIYATVEGSVKSDTENFCRMVVELDTHISV